MDLTTSRYATLADLTVYCRRVASAVGLATIEIFGYTNPKTRDYAVELGLALQLTNILRDVGGDAVQGRIYLPLEDLARFGVSESALLAAAKGSAARPEGLGALLAFEADRAREHYGRAQRPAAGRGPPLHGLGRGHGKHLSRAPRGGGAGGISPRSARQPVEGAQGLDRPSDGRSRDARVRVVVVGGGFAGLAAAIALQERRHEVLLLERRGVLGGRATSYRDAVSGDDVDNGTHLMIGAYSATLDLIHAARAEDLVLAQDDLHIDYVDDKGRSSLDCPRLPAPLHLLAGLLGLRVPWRVRIDALRLGLAIRLGRRPDGMTLAEYFRRTGQSAEARRLLWDPLAIAILNETPERAAAVLFWNVYREAFLASSRASRLVFLRRGYGVLQERLGAYFEARGGRLRRRALVESVEVDGDRAVGVRYSQRAEAREDIQRGKRAETR